MKLKLFVCKSMWREFSHMASFSPHEIDMTLIAPICGDDTEPFSYIENLTGEYDGVIVGFGLCSPVLEGITSKNYTLILPRAHNCISILLGSKERYRRICEENDGDILWHTRTLGQLGYGDFVSGNKKYYDYFCVVDDPFGQSKDSHCLPIYSDRACQKREYTEDLRLIADLVNGNWDSEDILVLNPQEAAFPSYTATVLEKA